MDDECWALAEGFVDKSYVRQARQAHNTQTRLFKTLLSQRKLPKDGLPDAVIESFLSTLSSMDSNNFLENVGVGEREARIYSSLVSSRHYALGHGIGRSGDLNAVQPKAAGSSLILALANRFALDALKIAGLSELKETAVVPLATGMAITLCLQTLRQERPLARYVIWPRIDQKTCLKAIYTADIEFPGLEAVVVENIIEGDELRTNIAAVKDKILELGKDSILCIASTTSCFAPRAPERVVDIAKTCAEYDIPHLVNNAYGVQSSETTAELTSAMRRGRVDLIVQSTDKNFMVPVGGAIIASANPQLLEKVSKCYPGRASMSPVLDLFITLLSMGASGFQGLLKEREDLFQYTKQRLAEIAVKHNERVLDTANNPISLAMSLQNLCSGGDRDSTYLGSMLFQRNCSGCRIVSTKAKSKVAGIEFQGYGAHCDNYPTAYLTVACAIGAEKGEIDTFMARLAKCLAEYSKKVSKKKQEQNPDGDEAGTEHKENGDGEQTAEQSKTCQPQRDSDTD